MIVLSTCAYTLILGWDVLQSASAVISCKEKVVHITDTAVAPISESPSSTLNLNADADYVLRPHHEHVIAVTSSQIADGDALIAPFSRCTTRGILVAPGLVRFSRGRAFVSATNTTPDAVLMPKGMTVATFSDPALISVAALCPSSSSAPATGSRSSFSLQAIIGSDLTATQSDALMALLDRHKSCFDNYTSALGKTTVAAHRIETDGSRIICRRPYRVSQSERKVIEEQVDDMLARNIIRPSSSPWASPVVLVKKKDGSVRFCVDYRVLNKITGKDVYPMPRIDDAWTHYRERNIFRALICDQDIGKFR